MKKFIIGLLLGLILNSGVAIAQSYMLGWTVTITTHEGLKVKCDDPYIWSSIKEIECDGGEID